MNVIVELAGGERACICGDVLYDIQNQVVEPLWQVLDYEPQVTGNHGTTKRAEKGAIKRALNSGDYVLPLHDYPARVRNGKIVSRLAREVPGPEEPVDHRSVAETGEMPASVLMPADPTGVPVTPPAEPVSV
jgi:hypothetical protein